MKVKLHTFLAIVIVGCLFATMVGGSNRQLSGEAPVMRVTPLTGSAVLDDWGRRFAVLGNLAGENSLRTQIRTTIAQLAMFDAVNAVLDGPYRPLASKPLSAPGASAEAAAISAAYNVALHEFPSQRTRIDNDYAASIAALVASNQAIADGTYVGKKAANAVLDIREGDFRNAADALGYTPGSGLGVWVPTPGGSTNPQTPFLQFVTPFGYEDPARFRPAPPPALDSRTYTNDYNEIKDVGRATDSSRTAEQSRTAQFWSPSATNLWSENVRSLAAKLDMDLLTAARFEAIGIAAATNGLLASWDAKYAYVFWRPVTAIRGGDTDGNSETEGDPTW